MHYIVIELHLQEAKAENFLVNELPEIDKEKDQ